MDFHVFKKRYISEERPSTKIHSIKMYSNQSDVISRCTLNELETPDLTRILSGNGVEKYDTHADDSNNDVFECVLQPNETAVINTKPLMVIFGMATLECISKKSSDIMTIG